MKLLILDFVRRRWWVFPVIAAFSLLGMATGQIFLFTHLVLAALLFDAQRGLLRVVRPLPVARRTQARAWWFIGVLLAPLVTVITQPAGVLIFQAQHLVQTVPVRTPGAALPYAFVRAPDYFAPWFASAFGVWVGLGYAALCFLTCIGLPTRPAKTTLETVWQNAFGGLWGLSMSGPMLFMFVLPKNPDVIRPWHWIIFALVPVLVVLSYVAAPDMADRRMRMMVPGRKVSPAPVDRDGEGLIGVALLLTNTIGRMLALLVFMLAVQFAVTRFMGLDHAKESFPFFSIQAVTFAIFLGAISCEALNLRVLRTLPLSTAQLAALLLTVPVTLGVACAIFITATGGASDPSLSAPLNFLARLLTVSGVGALALTTTLHFTSTKRLIVLMGSAVLPAFALIFFAKIALWLLFGGSAALVAACLLIMRGLRKSPAFYQPRTFFGLNVSQPLGGG